MFKILLFICMSSSALAIEYFDGGINYWDKKAVSHDEGPKADGPSKAPVEQEHAAFDWGKHLNPQTPEFFKEGEHTPPEPFMELVRNPSDENIRNWFALVETKNKLFARMNERMKEYAATQKDLKPEERAELKAVPAPAPVRIEDVQRFRLRLYFDSACPHCERMIKDTLAELSERGYYVELRQIDDGKTKYQIPFPATKATAAELDGKQIIATPVLFVGDTAKSVVYRIDGYRTTQEVLGVLATK